MADASVAEIEELENRRWAAQIAGDADALGGLLADELSYTHSNGMVDTKTSFVHNVANKVFDYRGEQRSDVSVQVVGDTAVATGLVEMHVVAGGGDHHLRSRYSAVWARRPDVGWQFVAWQSTPVPS